MNLPLILICGQAGSGKDTIASFLVKNHGAVAIAQADPMKRLGSKVFGFTEDALWGPSESRNAMNPVFSDEAFVDQVRIALKNKSFEYVREVLPGLSETEYAQAAEALENWGNALLDAALVEGGLSARKMLQTLGTEWGRTVSRDVWTNYAKKVAMQILGGGFRYNRATGLIADESFNASLVVITDGRFRNELVAVLAAGGETWKVEAPGVDGSAAEAGGVKGHKSETEQRSIPDHFFNATIINDKKHGLEAAERMTAYTFDERVVNGETIRSTTYWQTFEGMSISAPSRPAIIGTLRYKEGHRR